MTRNKMLLGQHFSFFQILKFLLDLKLRSYTIIVIINNCYRNFMNTATVSTVLSDFYKMIATVLKITFPKMKPRVVPYRDYARFSSHDFGEELKMKL